MKPLSGREASVLALLAQCLNLSVKDKRRYLSVLGGRALKIARVIVGETKHPSKSIQAAADGFIVWAKNLEE
jgi:hypothetical protein